MNLFCSAVWVEKRGLAKSSPDKSKVCSLLISKTFVVILHFDLLKISVGREINVSACSVSEKPDLSLFDL